MGRRLLDNVYIVNGKVKSCIYDLNEKKLYHINHALVKLIEDVVENGRTILTESEDEAIKRLETLRIIESVRTSKNKIANILSLKKETRIDFAWIEICNYCNLRCIHCYNESSPQCHDTMSLETFKYVCSELLNLGVKRIQLIGGEPFCNKHIKEMLQYATDNFEFVEVFTNGTMIDEVWCDFFKSRKINVALSVYSYDSKEHDKVTKIKGSHKKTIHTIKLFKEFDIKYRIATVHMKDISLGENNDNIYVLNTERDVIRMVGRGNLYLLTPDLLKRKLIDRGTFSKPLNPDWIIANVSGNRCFSSKVYISVELEVYPCVMERRISHGNLKNNSLARILNNEIFSFNKDVIEECKECEFRYACCDCRPDSITDNIYAKPYYCGYDVYKGVFINDDKIIANVYNLQDDTIY